MGISVAFAQKTVSGNVVDDQGIPLPGATILEQGTTNGVSSDFDGNFSIEVAEGAVLVISFVGYQTQEITVGAEDNINVALEAGNELDEVVVTSLGITREKQALGYAISEVDDTALEQRADGDIGRVLSGKASLSLNYKVPLNLIPVLSFLDIDYSYTSRVVAGAIAKQFLESIDFKAFVSKVGDIAIDDNYDKYNFSEIEKNIVRCPDPKVAKEMESHIKQVRKEGDTVGGIVTCIIKNVPVGLGDPVFDKLHAKLGQAMLSINAVKGFEFGSGFEGSKMKGSEHNDLFNSDGSTKTNYSGGIQGGISNGMDIYFKVAFKPVSTIMKPQETIDKKGNKVDILGKGRHDPCVVPRAVPIVEAMAALVIADFVLINRTVKK